MHRLNDCVAVAALVKRDATSVGDQSRWGNIGPIHCRGIDYEKYEKGRMIPADTGTRVVMLSQLLQSEWLNGPFCLKLKPSSLLEQSKLVVDDAIVSMINPTESIIDWSRSSKYQRMINAVVYSLILRSKQRGFVTALKSQKANFLIKQLTQQERFAEVFSKFEVNSGEKMNSDLAKLPSFVDSDNTTHLEGRLSYIYGGFETSNYTANQAFRGDSDVETNA